MHHALQRRRTPSWLSALGPAACLAAGLAAGIAPAVATAQRAPGTTALPALSGRPMPISNAGASLSAEQRGYEYDALAHDTRLLEQQLGLIKRVVRLVTPAVVHIEARPLREYRVRSDLQEAGSGVVVELGGRPYVLTNRHVIKHSSEPHIRVQLADGQVVNPTKMWSDKDTDIAVLSLGGVSLDGVSLAAVRLGDSSTIEIGEFVLAVGSPFGLSQSVTLGIISAKGRYNLDLGDGDVKYQNFLQTDAAINPGNSGGPLINLRGEVIGLNTAIASSSGGNEGIGFSIPINVAVRIASQLVDTGQVRRGFLGVQLDGYFDDKQARAVGLPRLTGARVKNVRHSTPAERAHLLPDDVILSYDGVRVEDDEHLVGLVKLTEIGRRIELIVFRDGQPVRATVMIGDEREDRGS
ncbi:putative serine protease HtrA [Pseudobythopirellula maris]|uniref:Putative serine protease HtrA n=1 Tax=Pseudobythopirellula maris TaxID=2527991 RepID=A0A5C5ZJ70_9BACT|nr:trypsin-like peptidase domain-containing protein [Pseudobythopirellula maris]TWT87296.1 putative serine protease HtrA [Pseudobythopirellula maris]